MALTDQNDSMYAGDNKTLEFAVVDALGAALNITGAAIEWVAWDGDIVVLRKTVGSGITITSGSGGLFQVILTPTDTYTLTPKAYQHGANVSIEAGAFETVSTGTMTIHRKVRQ